MENETNDPIWKVLRSLRPDHPLRQQALAVLNDPLAPVPEIGFCLYELTQPSPFRKKGHTVAFWLITHANWSDAQRTAISRTLSNAVLLELKAMKSSRSVQRWLLRGMFVMFPVALNVVLDLFIQTSPLQLEELFFCSLLALIPSLVLTIAGAAITLPLSFWIDKLNLKLFCPVVEALGYVGQPSYIVYLVEFAQDGSLQDIAVSALANFAARMRPEDYGTLPLQSVPILCQALTNKMPSKTMLLILQVLTVIGDGRAISSVEKLSTSAMDLEVRDAAANLLPILQQRARNSEASSLLLRASNAPPDIGQTLLRPAREQPDADPSQLLRMATQDAERP